MNVLLYDFLLPFGTLYTPDPDFTFSTLLSVACFAHLFPVPDAMFHIQLAVS